MRSQQLGRLSLILFSSPMMLFAAIELAWRVYLPSFLTTTLGIPVAAAAALLFAGRLFDGIADPAVGWASDRFRTRLGFRRPWLVAGAPLVSISALWLCHASPGTSMAAIVFWCLLLRIGHVMTSTPHGGWALEMAQTPAERARVMGARVWAGAAGTVAILLIPALAERLLGLDRADQFAMLGGSISLLAAVTILVVVRYVPEPNARPTTRTANLLVLLSQMLRDRQAARLMLLYGLVAAADAAANDTFLFFVEDALAMRGWGSTLLLLQAAIPLLALPVWARFAARRGNAQTLMIAYAWQSMVLPLAFLLPAGSLGPLVAWFVARSMTAGVDYMLLRAMVGDITHRELMGGLRLGSSHYALFNMIQRLAGGLGVLFALGMLGVTGFASGRSIATDDALLVRSLFAGPSLTAALGACLILSRGFRLPTLARSPAVASMVLQPSNVSPR